MRSNNQYLQKVQEELDAYRSHLLLGTELTPIQEQVFQKINIARGWLLKGYSDSQVLDILRNDPNVKLQDRRAREVLAITYDLYADIRLSRNPDGVKLLYAEMFKDAAQLVLTEAKNAFTDKDRKEGGDLMKTYKSLLAEAADLDGAYTAKNTDLSDKKKSTKVTMKRKTTVVNGQVKEEITKEAHVTG